MVPQTSTDSQMKKLEEQLAEAHRRGDDLQRALTEVNVAKNRLTGRWTHPDPLTSQCLYVRRMRVC